MSVKVFINRVEQDVLMWKFPTGEVGVQLINTIRVDLPDSAIVEVMFSGNDDIFYALNLIDALKNIGFKKHQILLEIPYLPYSRQDRVCNQGESFASKVLIDMLCTAGVTIRTYDMHSGTYQVNYLMNVPQYVCASCLPDFDLLIGPDKGSTGKVRDVAEVLGTNYIVLDKVRTESGIKITIPDGVSNLKGSVCIVDDLADKGGTFLSAATTLRNAFPEITSLNLYVTHAFFGAGVGQFEGLFDKIYYKFLYNKELFNERIMEKV